MNMVEEQIRMIQIQITILNQRRKQAETTQEKHYYKKKIEELTQTLTGLLPDFTTENKKTY